MEMHCDELQSSLLGSRICSITNGHLYCTALLKSSCCLTQRPHPSTPPTPNPPKLKSGESSTGKEPNRQQATIRRRRPSKRDSTTSFSSTGGNPFRRRMSSFTENSLRSWSVVDPVAESSLQSWVVISDSDLSGYEADVERGATSYLTEAGESCDELEESQLLSSLTSYLVPPEVCRQLWSLTPLSHCLELLKESMKGGLSVNW